MIKQPKWQSFLESLANIIVGYTVAVLTQLIVFPWFGLPAHVDTSLAIGGIFTLVSLVRSYMLRRLFESWRR